MSKEYQLSPFGIATGYPWLNKPDTKFNADGVYHVDLMVSGEEAQTLKDKVDAAAQLAFDAYFEEGDGKKIPPKERKAWSVYVPYKEDTDDAGNPTGYIVFDFKQNAKIKLKSGEVKDIMVSLKDAKNNPVHKPVFGGSELRTMFAFRDIPMKSLKQVGVRMDLAQVQIKKLAASQGRNFGEIEDGYVEEDGDTGFTNAGPGETSSGGDY